MKKNLIRMAVGALLVLCCGFTHRRVIKAVIKGEEMPKAPAWHCWLPKDKRRG